MNNIKSWVLQKVFCLIFTHIAVFFKNHEMITPGDNNIYIFFYSEYMFVLFEPKTFHV